MIYQYEWSADGTKLTPRGEEHIACLAKRLPSVTFPVVVEQTSDENLNQSRRAAVLNALAACHAPIDPNRVICGRSEAEGLYSQEAAGIARQWLGGTGGGSSGGQAAGTLGGGSQIGGMQGGLGGTSGGGAGIY